MSTITAVTVDNLQLSQIVPSTTNPRKSFDQTALDQLAESIKEIGVTVPILVRMKRDKNGEVELDERRNYRWELVSGHRRLKAATIAGLETIPAFIRELTDAEALDIQMVENLQRADLHPMDEAAGYQALIDAAADRGVALTQEELAHKVGKPLSYVAQRVKLLDLTETPRKVFQEGHINIGHALMLARLTPQLQDDGLRAIFDPNWQYSGTGKKKTAAEVVEISLKAAQTSHLGPRDAARPATEFRNWIKQNVELDLFDAPWDLAAENLHPTATSCLKCPKRSGNNPALFAELTTGEDKCTDPICFDIKAKTFVQIQLNAQTETGKPMLKLSGGKGYNPLDGAEKVIREGQWLEAKPKSCADARQGVMTDGSAMGKMLWVCINQKCKNHKHIVHKPQPVSSAPSQSKPPKGMSLEEHKAQQKRDEERDKAERLAIYLSIREAYANEVGREAAMLDYIVRALDGNNSEDPTMAFELNGWKKTGRWDKDNEILNEKVRTLQGDAFVSYLFDLMFSDMSDADGWKDFTKDLNELSGKYGVNQKAVLAEVKATRPELYAEPKPKMEKAAIAKKGTKKTAPKAPAKKAPKPTGKAAAANDFTDDEVDTLATVLADTAEDEDLGEDAKADDNGCPDCGKHWRDCDCELELEADEPDEEDED